MAAYTNVSLVSSTSSLQNVAILTENDGVPESKCESDAENYTVEQLKQWLKCRGIKQGGKRNNLVTRVPDSLSSGNHIVLDPSIDNGKWLQLKILKENNASVLSNIKKNELNIPVIVKKSSPKNLSADCQSTVRRQSADSLPTANQQVTDRLRKKKNCVKNEQLT